MTPCPDPERVERFVRQIPAMHLGRPRHPPVVDGPPWWVDALEESLLLGIGLFALITWVVLIAIFSH